MTPFTSDSQRYEYDLTPASLVLDVGGYHGNFAREISNRYHCTVFVFEPIFDVGEMPEGCHWLKCAVGGHTRLERFGVSADSTGMFKNDVDKALVPVMSIHSVVRNLSEVDLMKLNCEGMEYEILEYLITFNQILRFKNIQIQFHQCVEGYAERYEGVRWALSKTHELAWCSPFVWESWRRK